MTKIRLEPDVVTQILDAFTTKSIKYKRLASSIIHKGIQPHIALEKTFEAMMKFYDNPAVKGNYQQKDDGEKITYAHAPAGVSDVHVAYEKEDSSDLKEKILMSVEVSMNEKSPSKYLEDLNAATKHAVSFLNKHNTPESKIDECLIMLVSPNIPPYKDVASGINQALNVEGITGIVPLTLEGCLRISIETQRNPDVFHGMSYDQIASVFGGMGKELTQKVNDCCEQTDKKRAKNDLNALYGENLKNMLHRYLEASQGLNLGYGQDEGRDEGR